MDQVTRGWLYAVVAVLTHSLVGCGNADTGRAGGAGGALSAGAGGAAGDPGGGGWGPSDASRLFEPLTMPVFELTLPPERWEYLKAHARDEEYEPAELRFEGRVVGSVGLRFKGNIGTLANCFDDEDNLVCRKLSMKLKLDEYDSDLRLYGLKRLNLHSMVHDATLLHEKLAYDAYRAVGIAAPRSGWAVAHVNGESLGLFSLVEEVDGRFTRDRWKEDGDGNLYKEAWPLSNDPEAYAAALETNEESATHDAFLAFAAELREAKDAASRRRALGRWMDLEELARYMAVNDAIANVDGVTAIYCSPEDPAACGNHNYFFYLNEAQSRFRLVPWDLDATLWPQTAYDDVPPWHVVPDSCDERYSLTNDEATLSAPGCDPLFEALAHDLTDYDAAVDALWSGPFAPEALSAAVDRHSAWLAEAVAVEPGGQSVERWRSELGMLKSNFLRLQARAKARREGHSATAVHLSPTARNDFELPDDAVLGLLPSFSNSATTTRVSLASTEEPALEGARSLLLSFEYRNEGAVPWGQWINLALPFRGRPVDLTDYTGVRLTLRTESPRTVRIDLDSPLYEASLEGIKFGWEVAASSTPLTVELPFAEARLPSWARATRDELPTVRTRVEALAFQPLCIGRDGGGLLAEGAADAGFLELDAIELF